MKRSRDIFVTHRDMGIGLREGKSTLNDVGISYLVGSALQSGLLNF
jgi:hypothetical protein